jgi:SAM-dependent methyltransferase
VPDPLFAHPRLAPVYDAFDGPRDDLTVYLRLAGELGADRVLDIGCGTGSLAILLAAAGRTVAGVDPAGASLEVAKSTEKTTAITWIHGDATRAPRASADLAVMTGNAAPVRLLPVHLLARGPTAPSSFQTPPCGSALTMRSNRAWPATATG